MFASSIPADMQKIMWGMLKKWDCKNLYIGSSGNFVIERMVAPYEKFRLHSNDVTIYSGAIGNYLSGVPLDLAIDKAEYGEEFDWLEPYLQTHEGQVASVMLLNNFIDIYDKWGENDYYTRQVDAYKKQWDRMYGTQLPIVEELKGKMPLASYFEGDLMGYIGSVPDDEGFICFPPFLKGATAEAYTALEKVFTWTPPTYNKLTEDHKEEFLTKVMQKKHWLIGLTHLEDSLIDYLCGMAKTTNRGTTYYVYSNTEIGKKVVLPNQNVGNVNIKRLFTGEKIGTKMEIANLDTMQFQTLRSEYLNANIVPGAATRAFGVLVDGMLIGVFAVSMPDGAINLGNKVEMPNAYLLSDFAVAPTDYSRLSKLVLYAAISKESKFLIERSFNRRINSLTTTAFSKRNVSMKYRGLFKLMGKTLDETVVKSENENAYYAPYKLNYGANMGEWTLEEGLAMWKKKYGQTGGKVENE